LASEVTIFVCTTCKREGEPEDGPRAGAALAEAVMIQASGHRVQMVKCLSNCSRGPTAAIVSADGWTYIFGKLALEHTPEALHIGADLLSTSDDGIMPWKPRPEVLKRSIIARIPPFNFTPQEKPQ